MPEDFDRLQGLIYDVEAKVYDIQEQQANIRADVDIEDDEMMEIIKKHFHLDDKRGEVDGSSKHQ